MTKLKLAYDKIGSIIGKKDIVAVSIKCALLLLCAIASLFWSPFLISLLVLFSLFVVFENDFNSVIYLFALLPFSDILYYNTTSPNWFYYLLIAFVVFEGLKYAVNLLKKKEKVNWLFLVGFILFEIYLSIQIFLPFTNTELTVFLTSSAKYIFIFLLLCNYKKLNYKKIIIWFSVSLLLSTIVGLYIRHIDKALAILSEFRQYNKIKLSGLIEHPNIYCSYLLAAIGGMLILKYYKQIGFSFYIFIFVLTICGIGTISRQFVICFGIMMVVYSILYLTKYKKRAIKHLLFLYFIVLLSFGIMWDYTYCYLNRFGFINDRILKNSKIDVNITDEMKEFFNTKDDPGRLGIWERNLKDWSSSSKKVIFGTGLSAERIGNMTEHNTFLQILRRTGLIGCFASLVVVCGIIKEIFSNKKFYKPAILTSIATIVIILFIEPYLNNLALPLYCMLLFMGVFYDNEKFDQYKNKKECYTNEFKHLQVDDARLKQLQKVLLVIMKDLSDICEANNLNYSLAGGSMLGAVRHKGFIPWDDDMDLIMSNEDVEKLNEIIKRDYSDKYYIASAKYKNSQCLFYKVMLKNTKIVELESMNFPFEQNIFIDIFPYENIPTNKIIRKIKAYQLKIFKGFLTGYYTTKYPSKILKEKAKQNEFLRDRLGIMSILGTCAKMIGINRIVNMCYKTIKYENKTGLIGIPSSFGYERELFKSDFFNETIKVDFENLQLRIPKDYKTYLTNLYGDYMQIPPVEKREKHISVEMDFGEYDKIDSTK